MKFIGNKNRLLPFIDEVVKDTGIKKGTFIDLFSGTANVGAYFKKKGFRIISNDTLYFSYIFQMAVIKNNKSPVFKKLKLNGQLVDFNGVIDYLNQLDGEEGFIYKNYAPSGNKIGRQYFSNDNAKKIDAIRMQIQQWYDKKEITSSEYFLLLSILIDRSDFIANNSGTYGAYLKIWRSMALKKLELKEPEIIVSKQNNLVFNEDALKLIKKIKGDILYLDPPYNSRQYSSNYHLLETIAKYDNPKIYGKTGLRENGYLSPFCQKNKAEFALQDIISHAKVKFILLSYNDEGIISQKKILQILKTAGKVKTYKKIYRRYRSESDHDKRQYRTENNKTTEYIFLCKLIK